MTPQSMNDLAANPAAARAETLRGKAGSIGSAFRRLMADENGQAQVEYVIMLVALVGVTVVINEFFTTIVEDTMERYFEFLPFP